MSTSGRSTAAPLAGPSQLLCDRVWTASRHHADTVAVISAEQRVTYRALCQRANRLARLLIAHGIGPGDVVPIAFESSVDRIVAILGILAAGAAYLPLDTEAPPSRIASLIDDVKASVVVTSAEFKDRLGLGDREPVLVLGSPELTAAKAELSDAPIASHERLRPLKPSDIAYVIHTSGSTGRPKGVATSHAAITTSLDWIVGRLGLGPADRAIQRCDYTFDVSIWEIFSMLAYGGTLVLPKPGGARDSAHIGALIRAHAATVLYAVPTMLSEFVDSDGSRDCVSLKIIVCIGEALSGVLQQRVHAWHPTLALWNAYGPTEAAVGVTAWLCRREDGAKTPPLGRPASNTYIHLLDEDLAHVANGEPGEIFIAGDYLAQGYLGQPDLTAERFLLCPFGPPGARMYRTGDLAERRADGGLYYLGRNDSQVKFNGIRVELGEIEAAVASLTGVARVAVVAREIGGEDRLIAYVVIKPGAPALDTVEAKATLGERLPRYLTPSFFVTVSQFPKTTSAKLDVLALPDPNPEDGKTAYREPQGDLERFFAEAFARLIGVVRVGADDSFFDLGGTSLTAMRLASRVKAHTGRALPMRSLVEQGTPAGLARAMASAKRGEDVFTGLPPDSRPIVFLLPGVGGSDLALAAFAVACDPVLDVRILDYPDWRSLCAPGVTFQSWADEMTDQVIAQAPNGAINLAGYSLGGDVAYEIAHNLERRGRRTSLLVLIDTVAPADPAKPRRSRPRSLREKIAQAVRDREVVEAVANNTLGRLPVRLLPWANAVFSFGSAARREAVETRMVTTVRASLDKAWRRDALRYAPLPTPTFLFRIAPNSLDEGRFDGWWERAPNLSCREVDGDHWTLLTGANLNSFVATFVACALEALGLTRERRDVSRRGNPPHLAAAQSASTPRIDRRKHSLST